MSPLTDKYAELQLRRWRDVHRLLRRLAVGSAVTAVVLALELEISVGAKVLISLWVAVLVLTAFWCALEVGVINNTLGDDA